MARAKLSRRAKWGIGFLAAALIGACATPLVLQWLKDRELHEWLTLNNAPEAMRMLKKGADDRCPGGRGARHRPLSEIALRSGSSEMLSLLARRGRRFDEAELNGQSPLMIAVVAGNLPGVRFALERGVSPNTHATIPDDSADVADGPSRKGTPLIAAAALSAGPRDMQPIIEALLTAGADVNQADDSGQTPLMSAVEVSGLKSVRRLLQAGAKVDATDSRGRGVLHRVNSYTGYAQVLELLLKRGANVNLRDREGQTPLHRAVSERAMGTIATLVEHGADPTLADAAGKTPRDLVRETEPAMLRTSLLAALSGKWSHLNAQAAGAGSRPLSSLDKRVGALLN